MRTLLGNFALSIACISFIAPASAMADVLSTKSRKASFSSMASVIDGRFSQKSRSVIRQDGSISWSLQIYNGSYRGKYLVAARSAAQRHGIPEGLFLRLVEQESAWKSNARSHKGAIGLAQLMPQTAKYLGVNPHDPYQNLNGGARYLAEQYREFGSWRLALAAYNAGPNAVKKYNGIPPYKETINYVEAIWGS